jgi:hypothetical protein
LPVRPIVLTLQGAPVGQDLGRGEWV